MRHHAVIPSENASPARTDGSRHEILTLALRASSTPLRFTPRITVLFIKIHELQA
jgi:hypothetical protein